MYIHVPVTFSVTDVLFFIVPEYVCLSIHIKLPSYYNIWKEEEKKKKLNISTMNTQGCLSLR